MRFRLLAALAAVMIAGPAVAYDASRAPRYASPDMYRPNVEGLTINGSGLTCAPGAACDISGMKVTLPGGAPSSLPSAFIPSASNLPACVPGSTAAPVPAGQPFACGGFVLIAQ